MPASPQEQAIEDCRQQIASASDLGEMAAHLKTLRRMFTELRYLDRAWCAAAAASFLRRADAEEQRFHDQYKPATFTRARARMTEELWKLVDHPEEDRTISTILAAVSQSVAATRARKHKDWGLRRKDRRDIANDVLLFSKVFHYVNQVLGVPSPEVYLLPESPGEMEFANAMDKGQLVPSLVIGSGLLQGRTDKELVYVIAKRLTFMRPDHFVRWPTVCPTVAELKIVFLAACKLTQPSFEVEADVAQGVAQYVNHLQRSVAPQQRELLAVVVQRFLARKGEPDLHRWANAVDMTATRMGFLICNDLEAAASIVQTEPMGIGVPDPREKIRDLVLWSVSDGYFALRQILGLQIGQG
jgi:hypothetical protein